MQGFNGRRGERGLNFWAVSDIDGDELTEFVEKSSGDQGESGGVNPVVVSFTNTKPIAYVSDNDTFPQ